MNGNNISIVAQNTVVLSLERYEELMSQVREAEKFEEKVIQAFEVTEDYWDKGKISVSFQMTSIRECLVKAINRSEFRGKYTVHQNLGSNGCTYSCVITEAYQKELDLKNAPKEVEPDGEQ